MKKLARKKSKQTIYGYFFHIKTWNLEEKKKTDYLYLKAMLFIETSFMGGYSKDANPH